MKRSSRKDLKDILMACMVGASAYFAGYNSHECNHPNQPDESESSILYVDKGLGFEILGINDDYVHLPKYFPEPCPKEKPGHEQLMEELRSRLKNYR